MVFLLPPASCRLLLLIRPCFSSSTATPLPPSCPPPPLAKTQARPTSPTASRKRAPSSRNYEGWSRRSRTTTRPTSGGSRTWRSLWYVARRFSLVTLTRLFLQGSASEAGEEPDEIERLADQVFTEHQTQLSSLFDDWPDWASPDITGAYERAKEAAKAAKAAAAAERDRKTAESNARLAAFLAEKKRALEEKRQARATAASTTPGATGLASPARILPPQPPVASTSTTRGTGDGGAKRKRGSLTVAGEPEAKKTRAKAARKDPGPVLAHVIDPERMVRLSVFALFSLI